MRTRLPRPKNTMTTTAPELEQIKKEIHARQRFVISSHSRPDGDSIGSQLAMAYALKALGKLSMADCMLRWA